MLDLILTIIAFALLTGLPALNGPPLHDDHNILPVFDRSRLDRKSPKYAGWKRPRILTELTWTLAGPNFALQHLVNILLHAGVAVAAIPLALTLGLNPVPAALVVAAHPLAVAAVGSVGQRASILSALLLIAGIDATLYIGVVAGLPFAPLALAAKEDALGLLSLIGLLTRAGRKGAQQAREAAALSAINENTTLPFAQHHSRSVAKFIRLFPKWIAGLGFDIVHDLGGESWKQLPSIVAFFFILVFLSRSPVGLEIGLLLLLSPMVAYWFVPLPNAIVEARAYSLILPIGLAVAALDPPVWALVALVGWFATQAARRSFVHSSAERYWRSTASRSKLARINLAATLAGIDQLEEAERINREIVTTDSNCGVAWANIGLIAEARARPLYMQACIQYEQTGRRDGAYHAFRGELATARVLLERARALHPTDPSIARYHGYVDKIAKELLK